MLNRQRSETAHSLLLLTRWHFHRAPNNINGYQLWHLPEKNGRFSYLAIIHTSNMGYL
jgi:hypothetical protein